MKRILFLLFAVGLTANMTVMAGMSTSKVRKETRFLTDKMAYELSLSTQQYNDAYEINYDFIYSVRNIMDYVARGYEWALDDYYEALDIRNDDLRWVLSDAQYRRFLGAEYFYRPIYVTGGKWSFRVYVNYPNRSLFYFGVPYHYRTYCGAHYRPHFHHVSYYRGRYTNFNHYSAPHRVRDQRVFHSYRRSDFGSVRFRPNTSTRPHNAPTRPGNSPVRVHRQRVMVRLAQVPLLVLILLLVPERQQDLVRQHVPVRNLEEIALRLLSDHLHHPEVEDLVTMLLLIKMGIRIE